MPTPITIVDHCAHVVDYLVDREQMWFAFAERCRVWDLPHVRHDAREQARAATRRYHAMCSRLLGFAFEENGIVTAL